MENNEILKIYSEKDVGFQELMNKIDGLNLREFYGGFLMGF